jgi:hypothetical protein
MNRTLFFFIIICFCGSCVNKSVPENQSKSFQLYEKKSSTHTKVFFNNQLTETKYLNSFVVEGYLAGAGVAVLDVNNDDLPDLYFGGNQVADKLYLNKGNLRFEDISKSAGIGKESSWTSGIVVADVNGDGFDDIYVCKAIAGEAAKRRNLFYINQQNNTFKEIGSQIGIGDMGFSIMANFFDFDLDGDLDLYVCNQPPGTLAFRTSKKESLDYRFTDRLYRNDGNKFSDVTEEAGVKNYSYTLSATVSDINNDGLPDIYVACDYEEPDYLYMNQGDGTFLNKANEAFRHISNLSMGVDIADINNDGWQDIFVADMVAEDNFRNKTNMSGMNPEKFWMLVNSGYHPQYMFNTLQLNNGNGTFSEIAQMSGVSHSDWSWSPLFMDADHDSYRDLLVTNGQMKEVRNKDFIIGLEKGAEEMAQQGIDQLDIFFDISKSAPQQKIPNYMYRNKGNLSFEQKTKDWGLDDPNWSQGAAYADLDNDGDLDIILNNMNTEASIYESKTADNRLNNFLVIKLEGEGKNKRGLQSKVEIELGDNTYMAEVTPVRGYMSCSEPLVHFGLGSNKKVDKITVKWGDGSSSILTNQKANQSLVVKQAEAKAKPPALAKTPSFFKLEKNPGMRHIENAFDDYEREILIPHKMSTLGPSLCSGDINKDGLDDIYLGGAKGKSGQIYLQNASGGFTKLQSEVIDKDKKYEDVGARLFDMDNDGDLDLYVVSGGNESQRGSRDYQDRLYQNDGTGRFSQFTLPEINESGSKVLPIDYDGDNDFDLLVLGRQVPGQYGNAANSLLLEKTETGYTNVSREKGAIFENLGMATDAIWTDINGDKQNELIVVGEWMAIEVFEYSEGKFQSSALAASLSNTAGWWNTIKASDIDKDGDQDLIIGNLGLNIKFKASLNQPFKMYINDFDQNGTHDVYLAYYDKDSVLYPVRGRECSSQQMPFVKEKYETYGSFATASIDEVLDGRMTGSEILSAQIFESSVFLNNGKGEFRIMHLPLEAQVSPIHDIIVSDFDGDQNPDILAVGNYYNREIETTRSDASIGCLLLGDGNGNFKVSHPTQSGLFSYKDARALAKINGGKGTQILVANNNDFVDLYSLNTVIQ